MGPKDAAKGRKRRVEELSQFSLTVAKPLVNRLCTDLERGSSCGNAIVFLAENLDRLSLHEFTVNSVNDSAAAHGKC